MTELRQGLNDNTIEMKLHMVLDECESCFKLRCKFPQKITHRMDYNQRKTQFIELKLPRSVFNQSANGSLLIKSTVLSMEDFQRLDGRLQQNTVLTKLMKESQPVTRLTSNLQTRFP